jgi:NADH:ubiquinone reductase (H+-translocating)
LADVTDDDDERARSDRVGRVAVGPFMNVEDVTGLFVVGGASSVVRNGQPVPGVAQAANGHVIL